MDYAKYVIAFKAKGTDWHIKHYHEHNDEFRAYARKELLKRKISKSKLPWKVKAKKASALGRNNWLAKETNLRGL